MAKFIDLEGRVFGLEKLSEQLAKKMQEIEVAIRESAAGDVQELLAKMKSLENELKSKVDGDLFDNEIASLRELIGNMANMSPDSMKPIA